MTRAGPARILILASAAVALELACRLGAAPRAKVVPPSEMVAELGRLLAGGSLRPHLSDTLASVVLSLGLALAGGFALGLVLHGLPRARRLLDPLGAAWYAVPFFALYPVLLVLLGAGRLPVVAASALFSVPVVVLGTLRGLDRIPPVLRKVARVHRLGPVSEVLRVRLPGAAPHLLAGARMAVACSFAGVVTAELISAPSGVGHSIAHAYRHSEIPRIYALVLLVVSVTATVNGLLCAWEGRLRRRRGL